MTRVDPGDTNWLLLKTAWEAAGGRVFPYNGQMWEKLNDGDVIFFILKEVEYERSSLGAESKRHRGYYAPYAEEPPRE